MQPESFPLIDDVWGRVAEKERWLGQLERTGVENVRLRLAQNAASSGTSLPIGDEKITKAFVEEWVEWHTKRKQEVDEAHRATVTWWTKAAALGALAAAVFTFIGALAAVGQAIFAWLALSPRP
jgi:hypothetical protein